MACLDGTLLRFFDPGLTTYVATEKRLSPLSRLSGPLSFELPPESLFFLEKALGLFLGSARNSLSPFSGLPGFFHKLRGTGQTDFF